MKHRFLRRFGKSIPIHFATSSPGYSSRVTMQDFGLLRAAVQRGWKIFPVLSPLKHAIGTSAMFGQASNNLEQIEEWENLYCGCNWALATGEDSGVLAIEMDGEIGTKSYSWLVFDNQEDQLHNSPTLISRTEFGANNKVCAYYRWPTAVARHLLRGIVAPGMRIRGEGDSVLIPPSVRRDGTHYVFLQPEKAVATLPDWLMELICREPLE